MRKARIEVNGVPAGTLEEIGLERSRSYVFRYMEGYDGPPVSLTMPTSVSEYRFDAFPPFFDGLLPEGVMLESLLRLSKIDRNDHFAQLIAVGKDLVGAVTVTPLTVS